MTPKTLLLILAVIWFACLLLSNSIVAGSLLALILSVLLTALAVVIFYGEK